MQELLTDDEIVALCGATGLSWPIPLVTIPQDERAVTAAAFRGLRSLLVRKLATSTGAGAPAAEPELARIVARAAAATTIVIAHVSGVEQLGWVGAGIAAFVDDQGLVLDVVNATGIHGLQTSESTQAVEAIAAFVRSRFEPRADINPSSDGCILIAASTVQQVYRVQPARIEVGRTDPDTMVFVDSQPSSLSAVNAMIRTALQ